MTAGTYCNREAIITESNTSVTEAARLMRQYHVGSLIVVEKQGEENMPIGIVTDRDLVIEVLAQDVPPDSVMVQDIMSVDLFTVTEDMTLFSTLNVMRRHCVRRIPVVNSHGGLEGILCADDVVELIAEASNDLVSIISHEIKREKQEHP